MEKENRNLNFDILRVLAAFMVLSVHIGYHIGKDFGVGAHGVQLFFILSGYLTFASLQNKSALHYYKARMKSIFPTYYFCLVLVYLEDMVIAIPNGAVAEMLQGQCSIRFLRYVFFLQCFIPSDNWSMWNNHNALWSMSAFIGFYLIAPLLFKAIKNTYTGIAVVLLALISRPWMINIIKSIFSNYPEESHIEWFAEMNPLSELYCFLLGAVLFVAIKESKQYLYILVVLTGLIASSLTWYSYEILFVLAVALAAGCKSITSNNTIVKIITWLSKGCFTLYLIHPLVLTVEGYLYRKSGIANETIHGILLYLCCIVSSYFIYYCIISKIEHAIIKKKLKCFLP